MNDIDDPVKKLNRLIELNIQEQVYGLSTTTIVQNAWSNGSPLQIHGLVYELKTGLLEDLKLSHDSPSKIDDVYRLEAVQTSESAIITRTI